MEPISSFFDRVRPYVGGCPDFLINQAVIDTIIEFAKKTEIFRISFDNPEYSISVNTEKNNEIRFGIGVDKEKRPFKLISFAVDDKVFSLAEDTLVYLKTFGDINKRSGIWDTDKKYYNFPNRKTVAVFPVDTSELPEALTYFNFELVLVPVDSITKIDDEIYDNHREAIEFGAIARLKSHPDAQWYDIQASRFYRSEFETAMGCVIGSEFNRSNLPRMSRTSFI